MTHALAVIPAAGFGTRFEEGLPKPLVRLGGQPLIWHVLSRFAATGRVERAVIAARADHHDLFRLALGESPLPLLFVEGGATRRDSVGNALRASGASDDDFVCVHDAARPLIETADIVATLDAAMETGAAIAGFMVTDTVKRIFSGTILETVPRQDLFSATTPQVFRAAILREAYAKVGLAEVTDDAQLVERAGGRVRAVLTSRWNLKITYPEDLVVAEAILAERKMREGRP